MLNKPPLLVVTNLYPLAWEPNRATFNRQQFDLLKDEYELFILVPVAFMDWFKNRKVISNNHRIKYVPSLYTPKVGRRFYSYQMFFSILLFAGMWIRAIKPKKILASWAYPDAVASAWLARLYAADFYFKVHGSDINLHAGIPARGKQILKAAKSARAILSVSDALRQSLLALGVNEQKVVTIYNGVDHDLFAGRNDNDLDSAYILFVGNLKADKGVIELLEGFARFYKSTNKASNNDDSTKLKLVYAGSGEMLGELKVRAKNLEIADNVLFLGSIQHAVLPKWIGNAKALALPSYNEGVPNVVLEAMASGTPSLATNVGGIPEILPEHCGVLIPPRSSAAVEEGLAEIFDRLWVKAKIQEYSHQFSWKKNKKNLLDMLHK